MCQNVQNEIENRIKFEPIYKIYGPDKKLHFFPQGTSTKGASYDAFKGMKSFEVHFAQF